MRSRRPGAGQAGRAKRALAPPPRRQARSRPDPRTRATREGGAAFPEDAREILERGAADLGFPLSPGQLDAFGAYAADLQAGREEAGLTALTDPVDVATKHFLDSLAILAVVPAGAVRVIDVGSGAGFPGLPLKLARHELDVVLVEATAKKAAWLERTIGRLGLRGARAVAARAEDLGHDADHRGRYDVAAARAVASLPVLCELCLPFVRPGGRFVAPKSAAGAAVEVPQAARALALLGGRVHEVRPVPLAALPNRVLVVIEQVAPAPPRFPRRAGMPAKRPL